ncbi:MAG: DUF6089 family protein [Saprospiraceae bacterium]|nr:DUF6089 family protein [Saprospiraceae bacterium]MCF8249302.1 DUF6089 family protein [Saprospiraceae bacterium]MCF8279723.1 DUF6089 family protein [Bacteroidales bacterium]MCF8311421.1 DUF6089 family protein [Saprospiraceae bacterium]MCF8439921.1 DUF6089 family protein [Saprospiraceae bacterium]
MKQVKLLLLITLLPLLASSQQKWGGGIFLGMSNYWGDLVEKDRPVFENASPAFGIMVKNQATPNFGIRGSLNYGKLEANDKDNPGNENRGASFSKSLIELAVIGEYDFLGKRRYDGTTFKKTFSPYLLGGIGVNIGDPKTKNGDTDISNTHFSLPIGLGLRYDISSKLYLGLEYATRLTFSDQIDGVGEQTGNPDIKDVYNFGGLIIGFTFGDKDSDDDGVADEEDACPTIAGPVELGGCPDTDGDGIADREDACPNDAGEQRMNGCPDRDGDGVADNADDCPDDAGLRRFSGCPDTDGDNIIDKEDNCPTVAGIPAMNGCPDSDRDGITDAEDACPNEPGTAEFTGCPDTDNDGIADNEDACPNDPGIKRFNGCADTDNDGIEDPKDKCPTLPGLASNQGCPEIKAEDKAVLDLAMRNVQFETNSDKLLPSSVKVLEQIAEILSRYPGFKLSIDGYTDDRGNDFANQQLSENRARTCYNFLADRGVEKAILSFKGHGESNPIGDNSTNTGRQRNRRVVFTLSPN